VLPIQLANLRRKLPPSDRVALLHGDSAALPAPDASYERALIFFLLHEQPEAVRRATLAEALRVVRPGGRIVIVDLPPAAPLNPLYWPMVGVLRGLEPFALDLVARRHRAWLPAAAPIARLRKRTLFGGLYQLVTLDV
jgi:ubiquinone/menaquinone biosynthesis C-methylase UbiE